MNWLKNNGLLMKKYLLILIFNVIIYILTTYYLKSSDTQTVILLFIILISDYIIFNIDGPTKFKVYLDILFNLLIGFVLMLIIKDEYIYGITLLSTLIPNNIIYVRSRLSEKFFKRSLQYIGTFLIIVLCVFINLLINMFL